MPKSQNLYCLHCAQFVKPKFATRTMVLIVVTCGLWLLLKRFYKKQCPRCGSGRLIPSSPMDVAFEVVVSAKNEPDTTSRPEPKKPRKRRSKEQILMDELSKQEMTRERRRKTAIEQREERIKLGITHYTWDAGIHADPRCVENHGKVFACKSAPATGHPGEGNCKPLDGYCRCIAKPIIPGFID